MRNASLREAAIGHKRLFAHAITTALAALVCQAAIADSVLLGRVVGLADGDTVTVLDSSFVQHKIRVAGIDAPEKSQAFGNRSKAHLASLVMGKPVEVHWHKKDRYGRVVGLVMVGAVDAGLEQVRAGMAWHYTAYAREQSAEQQVSYAAAEADARLNHRGLWRDATPIAPWDFRAAKRQAHGSGP
ncbi:thermonuclease family protein [Ramlibacter humi]|uniref:Nuclease n=1 Tax=Ramlibacter humi TaxID=2530451 RepID=A0A4Z0CEA1_9BURK|nr:thermonuclease family protein [Ramlibacter humi]TFZ08948.1 nuclease [Ramlibacter humi]